MDERKAIRVHVIHERRFMHECPYCKMSKDKPIKLLANQIRCLAAKDDSGPPQQLVRQLGFCIELFMGVERSNLASLIEISY